MPEIRGGGLDNPFSEEEVWEAIKASPAEKAPGPDGFIGVFFRSCWQTIKHDIMKVFHQFYCIAGDNLATLNSALVVLIPKKDGVATVSDYMPIS
uniref:Reverse transcriptase domain-containing protein n=1 Tax=Aegilops tauschii subsp. strangulata TaxID=200361 RepID=A0A453F706_AEGTS